MRFGRLPDRRAARETDHAGEVARPALGEALPYEIAGGLACAIGEAGGIIDGENHRGGAVRPAQARPGEREQQEQQEQGAQRRADGRLARRERGDGAAQGEPEHAAQKGREGEKPGMGKLHLLGAAAMEEPPFTGEKQERGEREQLPERPAEKRGGAGQGE